MGGVRIAEEPTAAEPIDALDPSRCPTSAWRADCPACVSIGRWLDDIASDIAIQSFWQWRTRFSRSTAHPRWTSTTAVVLFSVPRVMKRITKPDASGTRGWPHPWATEASAIVKPAATEEVRPGHSNCSRHKPHFISAGQGRQSAAIEAVFAERVVSWGCGPLARWQPVPQRAIGLRRFCNPAPGETSD